MNTLIFRSIFGILFCCLFVVTTNAQIADDLYYTPNTVDFTVQDNVVEETASADAVNDDTQFYAGDVSNYDQAYEDDYYYQSRLRRFCNPYSGLSYYAPAYTNSYYYNNSPFAWSNNIYNQQVYSQNWWNNNRTYNNFYGSNYGYSNYNYVTNSNFAPYTSFGSTIYNNNNRGFYNYNTGGIYQNNPYNDPCIINNYVNNSIDNFNTRTNSKPIVNTRSDRERPTTYRTNDDKNKRTSGVRQPASTKSNTGNTRTNTTKNTSTPSPKPRYRSNENATKDNTTKSKNQNRSNFFNSLKNLGNSSSESTKSKNSSSRNNNYRSNNSSSRSYGSSSRSSSKSSGSRSTGRSSRSGGRN